jgi:hypothetical protein
VNEGEFSGCKYDPQNRESECFHVWESVGWELWQWCLCQRDVDTTKARCGFVLSRNACGSALLQNYRRPSPPRVRGGVQDGMRVKSGESNSGQEFAFWTQLCGPSGMVLVEKEDVTRGKKMWQQNGSRM